MCVRGEAVCVCVCTSVVTGLDQGSQKYDESTEKNNKQTKKKNPHVLHNQAAVKNTMRSEQRQRFAFADPSILGDVPDRTKQLRSDLNVLRTVSC